MEPKKWIQTKIKMEPSKPKPKPAQRTCTQKIFRQTQPKSHYVIRSTSRVEKVLDMIKKSANSSEIICMVKHSRINRSGWVPYEKLKMTEPLKVIEYFEDQINWPQIFALQKANAHLQQPLAFA